MQHPIRGYTILADRGFAIQDSVGMHCATVTTPVFTKRKETTNDVQQTRHIANIRDTCGTGHRTYSGHRVTGLVRQMYVILSATQPIDFIISKNRTFPTLDKITLK